MKKFPIRSKRIKKQDILNGDRIKYFSIIKYLNEPLTLKKRSSYTRIPKANIKQTGKATKFFPVY
jgi:hypothetical protein